MQIFYWDDVILEKLVSTGDIWTLKIVSINITNLKQCVKSVQMRENKDQKIFEYGHISRSDNIVFLLNLPQ